MRLVAKVFRRSCVAWATMASLFIGWPLFALDPAQGITQYNHGVWSRENGLFPAAVIALTQTADGRLWIGTDSGLQWFDGVRFLPWSPPAGQRIASEYVTALATSRDGTLWIGTHEGLSRWKGNQVRNFQTSKGPAGPAVTGIRIGHEGTVWVGTGGYHTGGLCRVEENNLRCDSSVSPLSGFGVASLFQDQGGSLWTGGFGLCRWKPGTSLACPFHDDSEIVQSIAQDPHGGIWVAGTGLKQVVDNRLVTYPIAPANPKLQIKVLLTDRDGGLWIGTHGQGLMRLHQGRIERFTQADGLSHDYVRSLLEDREGNIWVGTDGGLDRFREYAVTRISKREGIGDNAVNAVFPASQGGIWIGSGGGLNLFAGGHTAAYDVRHGLLGDNVMGVFQERSGRLWAFTASGLTYLDRGRFHPLQLPAGKNISMRAAVETTDRSVWVSDPRQGLIRIQDARAVQVIPWPKFENKRAWALEPDPDGGLWLGFAEGGIAYYKAGEPVRWYGSQHAVTDLHRSRDGSLWIATQAGLERLWKGRLDTFTIANGLPCNGIRALVEDDANGLWLNTDCGLAAIAPAALARWAERPGATVPIRVFEAADGMRKVLRAIGYFRNAIKSNDGRLWFATFDGVAVVNPNHLPENRIPPPVRIEEITAGQTRYSADSRLQLPPLTKELRINYTALSFVAPEKVRFRYRLDGFDREWKEDTTGGRQAVYTNLPPNRYTFRVIAANNDGVWNETGAALDFSIRPAFYQTRAFEALCAAAIALVLWLGYRMRLRQMRGRMTVQFETKMKERTRIAREMHDSLLQELAGFAAELEGLAKLASLPVVAKERLRDVRRQVERCAREAREFVWDLRAPAMEEVDLSQALRAAGEEITHGESVRFQVTVQGHPRPAPVKMQRQLLRIVQEATRNAVRYSRANEIAMEIVYLESDRVRVHMRDDGCGFDIEQVARQPDHWGLRTMRERAEQLGGELKILSAPGRGTTIDIVVPIASTA